MEKLLTEKQRLQMMENESYTLNMCSFSSIGLREKPRPGPFLPLSWPFLDQLGGQKEIIPFTPRHVQQAGRCLSTLQHQGDVEMQELLTMPELAKEVLALLWDSHP